MKIEADYFYVTGNYYLKTTGDRSIILVYPFPVDSLYGEVDSIYIFNLTSNTPVEFLDKKKNSLVFKADFGEFREIEILISYRQRLLGSRAEYILESTKGWRKPFEQADYQLIIPNDLEITLFSIPPDETVIADEERVYYWSRKNYMPEINMIFEFRKY